MALGIDFAASAVETYNWNRPKSSIAVAHKKNIMKTTAADLIEMLGEKKPIGVIGGAPCQYFSAGNSSPKIRDHRKGLPTRYARILKELNEKFDLDFFVFENVSGIKMARHKERFLKFKNLFEEAGFWLHEGILDAVDYGLPQKRARVFVVGLNKRKYSQGDFVFPDRKSKKHKSVRTSIGGLPDPVLFDRSSKQVAIPFHPNHWTMKPKSWRFSETNSLRMNSSLGRSFRVLSWDKPSWTVAYGNREVHVHPSKKRRLSVFEAMRLQGLPERYELRGTLSDQFRMVSDAVPRQVANALAKNILTCIRNKK